MAQVTLTINAESVTEMIDQLRSLAIPAGLTVTVKEQVVTPAKDHVQPTTAEKLDKALDKAIDEVERTEDAIAGAMPPLKKRGRPAKVVEEPVAEAAPVTVTQVTDSLFNDAKSALAEYVGGNKENGREKAIEMLKACGVSRLTELDAAGLQKFMALIKG